MRNLKEKCLFITFQPISKADGVSKKVIAQKDALIESGLETLFLYPTTDSKNVYTYFAENQIIKDNIKHCIINPYIYSKSFYTTILNYIKKNQITFLYIRYGLNSSPSFIRFLSECKKQNIIIFLEIATYPYDGELNSYKLKVAKLMENYFRNRLNNNIDRIITYSQDNSIYNIKTIKISNGVNPNNLPLLSERLNINNKINLIGVANLSFWHGYDRVIEGLKNYYKTKQKQEVYFTIVGGNINNPITKDLQLLINNYKLSKYVRILGPKDGNELNELFNEANIAVGCLGCHRKGIKEVRSLKNVEYAMRGIPFMYSEINIDFDKQKFIFKVPADETAINIHSIIDFWKELRINPSEIRKSVNHLTWNYQMNIVLKELIEIRNLSSNS